MSQSQQHCTQWGMLHWDQTPRKLFMLYRNENQFFTTFSNFKHGYVKKFYWSSHIFHWSSHFFISRGLRSDKFRGVWLRPKENYNNDNRLVFQEQELSYCLQWHDYTYFHSKDKFQSIFYLCSAHSVYDFLESLRNYQRQACVIYMIPTGISR